MTNSPVKTRRTQQERRDGTKKQIMDAAFIVLKNDGYAGFTIAKIADEAKISRGAILHHYPNKDVLIIATFEHLYEISQRLSEKRSSGLQSPSAVIDELITDSLDFFTGDHFWTIIEVSNAGAKNSNFRDQLRPITRKYRLPIEVTWQDRLSSTGVSPKDAEHIVGLTISVVRGLAFHMRMREDPSESKPMLDIWREMIWSHWPEYRTGLKADKSNLRG